MRYCLLYLVLCLVVHSDRQRRVDRRSRDALVMSTSTTLFVCMYAQAVLKFYMYAQAVLKFCMYAQAVLKFCMYAQAVLKSDILEVR
jgi:hypothetical protein